MNALASIPALPRRGLAVPTGGICITRLGLAIERLEAREAGPALEAAIFRALGWTVQSPASPRAGWRVRGPLALTWIAMPPVTRSTDAAAILVPPGWDHGCGIRGAHAFAWCKAWRGGERRFTETTCGTRPGALCRAALHAWRHILLEDGR